MKTKLRSILSLSLGTLLILSLLCGCGSKAASTEASSSVAVNNSSYGYTGSAEPDYFYTDDAYYDEAYYEKPSENYDYYAKEEGGAMLSGGGAGEQKAESFDKIIYSGNARVETVEFDSVLERVYAMVDSYGGFLEKSYVSGRDYYSSYYDRGGYRNASFTIRVPREAFQSFTGALEDLGSLTYSSYEAQNISTSYYDTQSREKTYRTEESRLLEMLDKADTVEDMLNIEDRLAMVRYNIESLTTTLNNWDSKISYSTVYLDVQEVRELTKETPITRTFGEELVQSVKESVEWLWQALQDGTIFVISAIPLLIIPAIIVVVIVLVIRSRKRKKAAKKAAAQQESGTEVDR